MTYHSHTAIVTEHSEVPNWFEEVASTSYCNQSHSHYLLWGNFATQNKDECPIKTEFLLYDLTEPYSIKALKRMKNKSSVSPGRRLLEGDGPSTSEDYYELPRSGRRVRRVRGRGGGGMLDISGKI